MKDKSNNLKQARVVLFTPIPNLKNGDRVIFTLEGQIYNEEPIAINIKQFHRNKINDNILNNPLKLFYERKDLKNFIGILASEETIKKLLQNDFFSLLLKLNKLILIGTINNQESSPLKWSFLSLKNREDITVLDLINLGEKSNFYNRIEKLVDIERLNSLKVGIIGLGSGGSFIALQLAKTGIGTLELFDFDYLELENVIRHITNFNDIGRLKIHAVSEILRNVNPFLNIKCHPVDITKDLSNFRKKLKDFDLILECTGIPAVSATLNELALLENVPVIFGFVYPNAQGGFVMRVIPEEVFNNRAPCLQCVLPKILSGLEKPILTKEQRLRYTDVSDVAELVASPGLAIDIVFISNFQAKLALMTLPKLGKVKESFKDKFKWSLNKFNFFFWFNEPYENQLEPLKILPAKIIRDEYCPHCNKENWQQREMENLINMNNS